MSSPRTASPVLALAACIVSLLAAPATTQNLPRVGRVEAHPYLGPACDNPGKEVGVVHEHVVRVPGATFLSLELSGVTLGDGSLLEVRSLRDDEAEYLTPQVLAQAGPWTSFFDGDAVRVRLWAAPGTRGNRFGIARVGVGEAAGGRPVDLCNAADQRVLWIDARVCRLMLTRTAGLFVGTAWLLDYKGVVVTAGHVLDTPDLLSITAEFNVPVSLADGTMVRATTANQYRWNTDPARRAFENVNADGPDWGVLALEANVSSLQFAGEAQRNVFLLQTPTSAIPTVTVLGFGADDTPNRTYNFALQTADGPLSALLATHQLRYRVDTEAGNSGSPILDRNTTRAIGVHTNGGCDTSASTFNHGWSIALPAFRSAIDRLSPDKPNLVARSFGPPARVATDNPYNIAARAANLGRQPSAAVNLAVYLSTDETITRADLRLTSFNLPGFTAGGGGTTGGNFVVPGTVAPGNYWIGIFVDDVNAIDEGDETDNTLSRPIEVYQGRADLVAGVDVATFPGPGIYVPGQTILAPIWIENRGEAAAPPSVTAVLLHDNPPPGLENGMLLALVPTPGLAPRQYLPMTVPVTIPWCAHNFGSGFIGCYADADEVIGESSELNNANNAAPRGVGNYQGADRRIAYDPRLRTGARTQTSATFRSTVGGDRASICVLRGTNDPRAQHYVLIWSASQSPFQFDETSNLSLMLINGAMFPRWFSTIVDSNFYRAEVNFPRLGTPLTSTIWTHGVFFDPNFQVTGFVPASIENRIVP